MNVVGRLCRSTQTSRGCRNLHITRAIRNAYEGPGKTTVTFISKEIGSRLLVNQCNEIGFTLNTGTKIIGPTILFPRHAVCWNIASSRHINEASLSLFTVLEPKPDLLVIGLDDQYDFEFMKNIRQCVQKLNIASEIVSVHKACTVYNFINEEGRYVIAALIPPKQPKVPLKLGQRDSVKQITDSNSAKSGKTDSAKTK
ncbi:hypothetical protein PUN28_007014 [Cardiocondyla obscurior]|uniref:NADH dehydrogenase [ubiquinone] 1 alpha subcomplex assembly factor 3 n=1 Tax=Cardiocondyla obscurior TaxID=286306 RepID=A0AAW2G2M5_9HYME